MAMFFDIYEQSLQNENTPIQTSKNLLLQVMCKKKIYIKTSIKIHYYISFIIPMFFLLQSKAFLKFSYPFSDWEGLRSYLAPLAY